MIKGLIDMNTELAIEQMKDGNYVVLNDWVYRLKNNELMCIDLERINSYLTKEDIEDDWFETMLSFDDIETIDWELFEPNFNLSDCVQVGGIGHKLYFEDDIKGFVRQLKGKIKPKCHTLYHYEQICKVIDELTGSRFK